MDYKFYFDKIVDLAFRKRSTPNILLSLGTTGLIAINSSTLLDVILKILEDKSIIHLNNLIYKENNYINMINVVFVIMIFSGIVLYGINRFSEHKKYKDQREDERKLRERQKIFVIESRGLSFALSASLKEEIENERRLGQIIPKTILFQDYQHQNGQALFTQENINGIKNDIASIQRDIRGYDRQDVKIIYGGITPVPYTFFVGSQIESHENIEIYAFNRQKEKWLALSEIDDGKRFNISGLEDIAHDTSEVILKIAVTYRVAEEGIQEILNNLLEIAMDMENKDFNSFFSHEKQMALADQFLQILKSLQEKNVKKIHLFLAAPNDIVFAFGRLYHSRNMPEIIVYQYQDYKFPHALNIKQEKIEEIILKPF